MSIEEQVLHTNEVAFWRSKVRELEQEKEKLAEAMTEFEKIAAKEAGEKERLVKEMAFLKQCQLHVRSSLTSEYIEDPLGSRRQSKDSYRRSSIAHPTHDDPERVLSPGRHVTINSTESDFMDMHEDDRKQSMLSDDESLPKNSSTKKTVRKLVSTPHRSSLAQSPRRQSVKPETNESKLAGFNTAIDKPGIKGLEGLGDSVVNSPPPSKKASLLPTKDVKPIDMKVKDISSEPKSANEPKSEKAANIADVKAGKAAEKELKPVVSRSRSGSAVKDDKKGKFELTDSHSRSNSKTSPNPTEKPTPKKTKDDKAAVAIPVKVDKSPKIEKPLGKIPDKPKKEPEVPKTQKSKANNAEEPASNPASKAKEAAAIEPKKEIKGKKGSDIPAEKATPKMARPSTKDSESKDIVPELKESRSHSRSKSSPTEMKATNKTRSRVQSEKDDMIRSAKIQLEYEAYVTKPTEPAASKAAKPKILEQIEPAPLKAAKSNAAGR